MTIYATPAEFEQELTPYEIEILLDFACGGTCPVSIDTVLKREFVNKMLKAGILKHECGQIIGNHEPLAMWLNEIKKVKVPYIKWVMPN